MNLGDIATQIYNEEFDGTSGAPSTTSISGWLSGNVGNLNNMIFTDFSWSGDFLQEEASIFKSLYLRDFYKRQANAAARGIINGSAQNLVLRVREGDSDIQLVNRNEVSKNLASISRQYGEDLTAQIAAYLSFNAYPRQTAGNDMYYAPNWCSPPPTGQFG